MSAVTGLAIISKLFDTRISVSVPWDRELVDYFKTIKQRMWDSESKEWSFPGHALDSIAKRLAEKYQVVVREFKPIIHVIETCGTHSEIRGEYDPTIYKLIEDVPNTTWDQTKKLFFIPNEHLDSFIDQLVKQHISFTLSNGKPTEVKKETTKSRTYTKS